MVLIEQGKIPQAETIQPNLAKESDERYSQPVDANLLQNLAGHFIDYHEWKIKNSGGLEKTGAERSFDNFAQVYSNLNKYIGGENMPGQALLDDLGTRLDRAEERLGSASPREQDRLAQEIDGLRAAINFVDNEIKHPTSQEQLAKMNDDLVKEKSKTDDGLETKQEERKTETWPVFNEQLERDNDMCIQMLRATEKSPGLGGPKAAEQTVTSAINRFAQWLGRPEIDFSKYEAKLAILEDPVVSGVAGRPVRRISLSFKNQQDLLACISEIYGEGRVGTDDTRGLYIPRESFSRVNTIYGQSAGIILTLEGQETTASRHETMHSIDPNKDAREGANRALEELFTYASHIQETLEEYDIDVSRKWEILMYEVSRPEYYAKYVPEDTEQSGYPAYQQNIQKVIDQYRQLEESGGNVSALRRVGETKTVEDFLSL